LLEQAREFIDERDSGNVRIKDETVLKARKINRKVYLVMDSVIFSNRTKVKRYEEIAKGRILFCPPSSPQLNPIEEWFTQLRLKIRASTYSTN
jgi:transposase